MRKGENNSSTMDMTGITERLWHRSHQLHFQALPSDVVVIAKQCILDWLAVTLAGSTEPLASILFEEVRGEQCQGPATLVGANFTTSPSWAAFVNGAVGHVLDYDDTNLVMVGHPTVAVMPAVLAQAEADRASGRELIASFVAGVELACALGRILGLGHYAQGWHATGTLGTFGAAAGVACLLDLPRERALAALGLAGVQATGLKAAFGSMAKPFQVGKAALNGLMAARLAYRGFTAPLSIVEMAQGFGPTHAPTIEEGDGLESLEGNFLIRQTLFKYHAACYLTQSSIENMLRLREEHELRPEQVENVRLIVAPSLLDVCGIRNPVSGLESKFSLTTTAAMALLGYDTSDPKTFNDNVAQDSRLDEVRRRVEVVVDRNFSDALSMAVVTLKGGKVVTSTYDSGHPEGDLERQRERLRRKFFRLVQPFLGTARTAHLYALANRLEELNPATTLLDPCRGQVCGDNP